MTDFASGSGLSSSAGATGFVAAGLASFLSGVAGVAGAAGAEIVVLAGATGVFTVAAAVAATAATGSWWIEAMDGWLTGASTLAQSSSSCSLGFEAALVSERALEVASAAAVKSERPNLLA